MIYRIIFIFSLVSTQAVLAQEDCNKLSDHNLTVQCLRKENQVLNHQLRNAQQELEKRLKQAEQALSERYRGKLLKRYKAASKAWEKFRDAQCDYERMHALGGIEEPIVTYQCRNQLTKEYLDDLQEQIKAWTYE